MHGFILTSLTETDSSWASIVIKKKKKIDKVNMDMRWILIGESYQQWKFVKYGTFTWSSPRLFCFKSSTIYCLKILISISKKKKKTLPHFWLAGGDVFLEDIIVDIFFLSSVTYTLDTQIFTKLEKQLCKLFLFDILIISYEKFLVLIYLCIVILKP